MHDYKDFSIETNFSWGKLTDGSGMIVDSFVREIILTIKGGKIRDIKIENGCLENLVLWLSPNTKVFKDIFEKELQRIEKEYKEKADKYDALVRKLGDIIDDDIRRN